MRIKEILTLNGEGQSLTVRGWVRTKREVGHLTFVELNDGSMLKGLQIVIEQGSPAWDDETMKKILTGASLEAAGTLQPSEGKGQSLELAASSITVLGEVPADYPLQKKRHSFEFLREIAHLRPRTNTFAAMSRVRNALAFAVHEFFQKRDFLYIHTPIITGSDAEGAGQMFQVTTLDPDKMRSLKGPVDYKRDFFGRKTHLTVSGQLQAENFACSLGNVYTFGPTFRAENSNTSRHLAEFWMVEPEMAFCDLDGDADLAEAFIKEILKAALERCPDDMAFFDQWVLKDNLKTLVGLLEKPFARMTYTEAIGHLEKKAGDFEYKPVWGSDLQTEHERYLTESVVGGAVVVTDYPKDIKAFYMKQNDDGKTVRAMDVLVPRLGEIIGGSQREDDLEKLRRRMAEMKMDEAEYGWYLDLRRYGTVPHAGFGLGFERLVQYVTGLQNIRDVIPFPRYVKHAEF